ncbi:hypothetical protein HED54_07415 [Ochrobactrum anthropi ATCC 49188]|nr:hypothetical protein [Brucella anthropi ATCC 49188]
MNQIKNLSFLILKRATRKHNQNAHTLKKTPVTRSYGFSEGPHFRAFTQAVIFSEILQLEAGQVEKRPL